MAEPLPIDILRPEGNYRAFDRPLTLSGQRYRALFEPSEPARGSGWWMSLFKVTGEVLVRSVRLVPSTDLIAFARNTVDGLPPGRLVLTAETDPALEDLTIEGLVTLTYEVD